MCAALTRRSSRIVVRVELGVKLQLSYTSTSLCVVQRVCLCVFVCVRVHERERGGESVVYSGDLVFLALSNNTWKLRPRVLSRNTRE